MVELDVKDNYCSIAYTHQILDKSFKQTLIGIVASDGME